MNGKVISRIILGIMIYAAFVVAVISYYPDKPEDMDWRDREAYNLVQINKLALGTSRSEVLATLGSPDITEAKKVGNDTIQVMFYRTQHRKSDGITTLDECTPLVFENDTLVAWGGDAYQSYLDG